MPHLAMDQFDTREEFHVAYWSQPQRGVHSQCRSICAICSFGVLEEHSPPGCLVQSSFLGNGNKKNLSNMAAFHKVVPEKS